MAKLSTIPAEIISMILLLVQPEDLENFAQCCKEVRQQAERKKGDNAQSLLQEHRTLIRKYSDLTELEDIGPFLKATTANQQVARYVRKMDFGPLRNNFSFSNWSIQDILKDREIYEFLVSAARAVQIDVLSSSASRNREYNLQEHRENTIWWICRDADLAVALLVPLLPNLTALSFPWRSEGRSQWAKHWIGKLANSSTPILKKLTELQIHSRLQGCTLSELICLTALPSLRTLVIGNLERPDFPYDRSLWPQPESQPRNYIENLKLWDCMLENWMLDKYLKSFHHLKTFAFRGWTDASDTMLIFTVLLSHSQHTLTKIYFHSDSVADSMADNVGTAKPPFKQFPNLQELYVDLHILLPQPYSAGQSSEALLPQSLEALTIHDHYLWEEPKDWDAQFVKKRLEPIVEDLISYKASGLSGIRAFSFTALCGLHYRPENHMEVYLVGIEEVELGFRNRCARAGLCFSFKERESRMAELREKHWPNFGALRVHADD